LNHIRTMRSASGSRDHTKRQPAIKRYGGRRDNDGLQSSTLIRELENTICDLRRQLHEERVGFIFDLRMAAGLVSEKERNESPAELAKIPADGLAIMRRDLVKVLTKLSNIASSPSPSTQASREDERYIA
jgi:hypothetical protein